MHDIIRLCYRIRPIPWVLLLLLLSFSQVPPIFTLCSRNMQAVTKTEPPFFKFFFLPLLRSIFISLPRRKRKRGASFFFSSLLFPLRDNGDQDLSLLSSLEGDKDGLWVADISDPRAMQEATEREGRSFLPPHAFFFHLEIMKILDLSLSLSLSLSSWKGRGRRRDNEELRRKRASGIGRKPRRSLSPRCTDKGKKREHFFGSSLF